jgi:hypothetical protein
MRKQQSRLSKLLKLLLQTASWINRSRKVRERHVKEKRKGPLNQTLQAGKQNGA